MILGAVLFLGGVIVAFGSRFGLGRLPGDFAMKSGNTRFYFPLATSIILSIVLTVVLNLAMRFFNK